MRAREIVIASSLVMCAVAPAVAQKAQVAESLFREGKKLMEQGKIAEACGKFEGSYAKDPAVSTLLNLANCREKNGQFASAWGHFIDAERMTRGKADQATLNATARTRAAELEPRLSKLIISVPDDSRVEGLMITRNGIEVDPAEWNVDIPVDGGTYKIEGKAPAYEAWSTEVTIGAQKDKKSVNVPKFRALPPSAVSANAAGGAGTGGAGGDEPSSFTGKRKLAVGAWALGAVGIGSGIFLEISARDTYEKSKVEPDNDRQTELYNSANQKRLFAGIATGVGAAAIGAGVYLWITGSPAAVEESPKPGIGFAPSFGPDRAGFVVSGSF